MTPRGRGRYRVENIYPGQRLVIVPYPSCISPYTGVPYHGEDLSNRLRITSLSGNPLSDYADPHVAGGSLIYECDIENLDWLVKESLSDGKLEVSRRHALNYNAASM